MSTYVFSDVHGHRAPLERALDRISPSEDDRFFCLGDMIDRGPDSVGVIRCVRSLPNVTVLMGNHEDLMLACLDHADDGMAAVNWGINGGAMTSKGLAKLSSDESDEIVDWIRNLPLWGYVQVGGRYYLLVHAGLRPGVAPVPPMWNDLAVETFLAKQDPEDLVWIREEFWGRPTGLVDSRGEGPIVIAGHTPTPYLDSMTDAMDRPSRKDGLARMVRVGAQASTGRVADRWDIDAGAAGGFGFGQVLVLRLEDGAEFYEPVREGE